MPGGPTVHVEGEWWRTVVTVTADKPGREVVVEYQVDDEATLVSLAIEGAVGHDNWTWLAPAEARAVADALYATANMLDPDDYDEGER